MILKYLMTPAILVATLAAPLHAAQAKTTDILIGLDEKIVYGPDGQVNGSSDKDAVLIMDVSKPGQPRIRATLPLTNSLLGPPTNLQITPDGRLGLVANSVVAAKDGDAWKMVPDDKLYVIDLDAATPALIATVTVGKQPSGLTIARGGHLALIANRAGKSVTVLSIEGREVKVVGEVPMSSEVAAVALAPDGKRAFAVMNLVNKVAVLEIDGQKVTAHPEFDIPAGFNPYNVDMTPDGKFAVVSCTGAGKNNADALVVIEATGPHPHVIDLATPGTGPEGFAISPNGKWLVTPLLRGSGNKYADWSYTRNGEAVLMSVAKTGHLNVVNRLPLGGLPEAIAYSPNSEYVYIGNYNDRNLQVFHIAAGKLVSVGVPIKLPGQPASMRGVAR